MPDIDGGKLKPGAPVSVMKQSATTALVDGGWNFGQVAAMKGMEVAMMKAQVHDIGMVGVINCNHVGRLADYVMAAADKGLIGIMAVKTSSLVAPYGGTKRILGPNPLGIAIPVEGGKPFVLDIATSASAAGKVNIRRLKGEKLPEGWLVDAGGKPTTDPNDLFSGGSLLPFGGYKGYGLCVAVDILGGALTGLGCGTGMGGGYGAFACGALLIDTMGKEVLARVFVEREWSEQDGAIMLEERKLHPGWDWIDCRWVFLKGSRRTEVRFGHRLYSAVELSSLLLEAGFADVKAFGDLQGAPYDHTARRLIVVARKGERP
jgi:hypothetical protein